MIRESITLDEALEVLNRMVAADPMAVTRLIEARVLCNESLAADPTIQVGHVNDDPEKPLEVGFLGVLNGLFGLDDAAICAVSDTVCPGGCTESQSGGVPTPYPDLKLGDPCPVCGKPFILGKTTLFRRLRPVDGGAP